MKLNKEEYEQLLERIEECYYNNDTSYSALKGFKKDVENIHSLVKEYFELAQENKRLQRFKDYFDDLHNTGLEVANWHLNGDLEPFDNFYDSAMEWSERDETN